ncbi:MAG: MCP four helix bundle domain-containing protein [Bacillota bacterium]|nr:MCP four helix bundle domain-containing protein [Bacillota bacterium]
MGFLADMKIGTKLRYAFALISIFLLLVGFVGIYNTQKLNANTDSLYNNDLAGVKDINNIKANILEINLNVLQLMNTQDKEVIKKLENNISFLSNDKLILEFKKTIIKDEDMDQFKQLKNLLILYKERQQDLMKKINNGQLDDARISYAKFNLSCISVTDALVSYVKLKTDYSSEAFRDSNTL